MDYSKGLALHRLYGHFTFMMEAAKRKKDMRFARSICAAIGCTNKQTDWRDHLEFQD